MLLAFDDAASASSTRLLDAWARQLDLRVLPRRWFGRLRRDTTELRPNLDALSAQQQPPDLA